MPEELDFGPDIISVTDEEGTEHTFECLDRIETDDARYVAITPVYENAEDMLDDAGELIVLRVQEEDGETFLVPIEDEKEYDRISAAFEERLSEEYDFIDADDIVPEDNVEP